MIRSNFEVFRFSPKALELHVSQLVVVYKIIYIYLQKIFLIAFSPYFWIFIWVFNFHLSFLNLPSLHKAPFSILYIQFFFRIFSLGFILNWEFLVPISQLPLHKAPFSIRYTQFFFVFFLLGFHWSLGSHHESEFYSRSSRPCQHWWMHFHLGIPGRRSRAIRTRVSQEQTRKCSVGNGIVDCRNGGITDTFIKTNI